MCFGLNVGLDSTVWVVGKSQLVSVIESSVIHSLNIFVCQIDIYGVTSFLEFVIIVCQTHGIHIWNLLRLLGFYSSNLRPQVLTLPALSCFFIYLASSGCALSFNCLQPYNWLTAVWLMLLMKTTSCSHMRIADDHSLRSISRLIRFFTEWHVISGFIVWLLKLILAKVFEKLLHFHVAPGCQIMLLCPGSVGVVVIWTSQGTVMFHIDTHIWFFRKIKFWNF